MERLPGRVLPEERTLGVATVPSYEVAACMRALVRAAESRASSIAGHPARALLETSAFTDGLLARASRLTGLTPTLLPASR